MTLRGSLGALSVCRRHKEGCMGQRIAYAVGLLAFGLVHAYVAFVLVFLG